MSFVSAVQVQEELSRVVGSRCVRVEDRKNLPYTDAVIHETQRLANIVPMSVFHKTSQDISFQGYFIKKVTYSTQMCVDTKALFSWCMFLPFVLLFCLQGTIVIPLLTSVLHDESEWETPHSFNPSHFLDDDGTFVLRDAFMPFSAGMTTSVCF